MRRAAIFVLSDVRSGSTLLDQCLGGNPNIVSLGEVHWLAAYVLEDRSIYDPVHPLVCTCGKPLGECNFWRRIEKSLGRPLESLQLRPAFAIPKGRQGLRARIRRLSRRFVEAVPRSYRFKPLRAAIGGRRLGKDSIELFDAVSTASGCSFCVDSSKSPFRFRSVYELEPTRTVAVILVRDYRAVVHSKMKRGLSLEDAAIGWRRKMTQITALTDDLPVDRVHTLKYESLCESPRNELARICGFLDLEFAEAMLRRPTEDIHHIGGSPSKFDASRSTISLDRSYLDQLLPDDLLRMRTLVGDVAETWGY